MKSWQRTEQRIKEYASLKWGCKATPIRIDGYNIDAVLETSPDYHIALEITENDRLEKIREDINKLVAVRNIKNKDYIFTKCIMVVDGNVTSDMTASCHAQHIDIYSVEQFFNDVTNYKNYAMIRKSKSFGSCIDIESGKAEDSAYIPVKYLRFLIESDADIKEKNKITIEEIVKFLEKKKKIILLGEYGSGKSRCLKQLFDVISEKNNSFHSIPIAINLRDCHGLISASEIIRRHYNDLGIGDSVDSFLKVWDRENITYLLDGFDEVATQTWSDNKDIVISSRFKSLSGARSIIQHSNGGIIICGREHYFSSTKEMLHSLGIKPADAVLIKCREEFEPLEFESYIESLNLPAYPTWLPKRPLICSLLNRFTQEEQKTILKNNSGEVEFWNEFIDAICTREEQMFPGMVGAVIKKILIRLSRYTRKKGGDVGPITPSEIKEAFESVMGSSPIENSAIILQRLVGLGRYESESENRRFADIYLLDGLRGMDVNEIIATNSKDSSIVTSWINPVKKLGVQLIAKECTKLEIAKKALDVLAKCQYTNAILASDVIAGLIQARYSGSFHDYALPNGHFSVIDTRSYFPEKLTFNEVIIDELHVGKNRTSTFYMRDCLIGKVHGIANPQSIPDWMIGCKIDEYKTTANIAEIKDSDLDDSHKVLLIIIHKVFFQKGAARKEEALLRGFNSGAPNAKVKRIINLLIAEGILDKQIGKEGNIYRPCLKAKSRVSSLRELRDASNDPIWARVSRL